MVLGPGKGEAISGSELLAWYFRTFEAAIAAGGRKILVIGYGFADDHMNAALSKAVDTAKLEVSVMTRETDKPVKFPEI